MAVISQAPQSLLQHSRGRKVTAIVLAGGFGTRVRALYPNIPKPMILVAGRPFLDWVLLYLQAEGVCDVIISAGYRGDVVAKHYETVPIPNMQVRVVQEPSPLGTGGGFLHAQQFTSAERLIVMNGDSLVLAPIKQLAAEDSSDSAAVLGVEVEDSSRYGTLEIGARGRLAGFREKQSGAGFVNAGVYSFSREILKLFPAQRPLSLETDVFPALLKAGCDARVYRCRAPFLDIGTPESLAAATSFVDLHFPAGVR